MLLYISKACMSGLCELVLLFLVTSVLSLTARRFLLTFLRLRLELFQKRILVVLLPCKLIFPHLRIRPRRIALLAKDDIPQYIAMRNQDNLLLRPRPQELPDVSRARALSAEVVAAYCPFLKTQSSESEDMSIPLNSGSFSRSERREPVSHG